MLNEKNIYEWISGINNSELAEITSILFAKNITLTNKYIELLHDANFYIRLSMLHTLSKIGMNLNEKEIEEIIKSINISDTDNISAARAIESILLTADIKGQKEITTEFTKILSQTKTTYSEYICKSLNY